MKWLAKLGKAVKLQARLSMRLRVGLVSGVFLLAAVPQGVDGWQAGFSPAAIYSAINAQVQSAYAASVRVVNGVQLFYRLSRFAAQPQETSALRPTATPHLESATTKEILRLCTIKPLTARTKLRS